MTKFFHRFQKLAGVVYKTDNVAVEQVQKGTGSSVCFIIGAGKSLELNQENRVVKSDPFMEHSDYYIDKQYSVYEFYFNSRCSGLNAAAKEIAEFADTLRDKYERIILVGHSKCGLCLYQAVQYCHVEPVLVTVSTPYKGTFMADKNYMKAHYKSLFLLAYLLVFSNHKVDQDIIPDSPFLKTLHDQPIKNFIVYTSEISKEPATKDMADRFLRIVDRKFGIKGDGVVPLESQERGGVQTRKMSCSHGTSLKKALIDYQEIMQK